MKLCAIAGVFPIKDRLEIKKDMSDTDFIPPDDQFSVILYLSYKVHSQFSPCLMSMYSF